MSEYLRSITLVDGLVTAVAFQQIQSSDLPLGTTLAPGAVQPDGETITISNGIISAVGGGGGGSGTVTSVSVVSANGVSGTVANATATPAITLTLGAIAPGSVNGVTLSGSGSLANSGTSSLTGFTGSGSSSGTNTGDQTLAGLGGAPSSTTLTINGTAYDLSANRTWSLGTVTAVSGAGGEITSTGGTTPVLALATTGATAGSYTSANVTVDAYGRITAISNGSGGSSGDMLSNSVNAENDLSNPSGTTLTANTWNAITATAASSVTLPAATAGHVIGIEIASASTALVTLNPPSGGAKIQPGANTSRIMWAGESAILRANGTDWVKVGGLSIPMFAQIYLNTSQTLANSTIGQVNCGAVNADNTGGIMTSGTATSYNILIHRAGIYWINGLVTFEFDTNSIDTQARFGRNSASTNPAFYLSKFTSNSGDWPTPSTTFPFALSASDSITLGGYQTSGGTVTLNTGTGGSALTVLEVPSW